MSGSHSRQKRMFYNDDGNTCLLTYRGALRQEMVTDAVDVLVGTPITTLVLCVCYSDLVTYPSELTPMLGWRDTPSFHSSPLYRRAKAFFDKVREQGWDIPKMVMKRAQEKGLEFIPSMRMNDAHFAQKVPPIGHPLTGEWWMEHQDLIISPNTQWQDGSYEDFVLDFTYPQVREHRLAQAFEIIDRYAADGFETDWTRHPRYFPDGRVQPELITEMMRQIRQHLDERAQTTGRKLPLLARIPGGSIQGALDRGLDVATWVEEGLVDYIIPADEDRRIAFDLPVDEWKSLVEGTSVEVHPSPESSSCRGDRQGQATLEMYRAAASNYYFMGADGIYFFNLFTRGYPLEDDAYVIMRDLSDPAALSRRDKLFMATYRNWRPDTDTLPVTLTAPDKPVRVGLMVGDDLQRARNNTTLREATLRLRLDKWGPDDQIEVRLNEEPLDLSGARVLHPDMRDEVRWNAETAPWTYERAVLSGPGLWIEFDLHNTLPRQGDNRIEIKLLTVPDADREFDLTLTDVDLRVTYDFVGKDGPGSRL